MNFNTPYKDLLPPLQTKELEALKADIEVDGVLVPIIVDEDGNILDGHHRYQIEPNAPYIVRDGMTESEKVAFVLGNNMKRRNLSPNQKDDLRNKQIEIAKKLNEEGRTQAQIGQMLGVAQRTISTWLSVPNSNGANGHKKDARVKIPKKAHDEIVAQVDDGKTQEQVAADFGVDRSTISKIVAKKEKEREREEKQKQIEEQKQSADSGEIAVICGDMLNILPSMPNTFDLVVADPPYNVTGWEWDKIDDFVNTSSKWIDAVLASVKDEYNLFWFCSPRYAADIEMLFRIKKMPIQSRIVWHRRNMAKGGDAKNKFLNSWEMIYHIGNRELNFDLEWGDERFDVQTFAVPQTNFKDVKYHPTQKPKELIKWLVKHGSYIGDNVLDPFAGSGTTGTVCEGRNCTLIEKEEEYVSIIKTRLLQ